MNTINTNTYSIIILHTLYVYYKHYKHTKNEAVNTVILVNREQSSKTDTG